jgi:hypothetical protein
LRIGTPATYLPSPKLGILKSLFLRFSVVQTAVPLRMRRKSPSQAAWWFDPEVIVDCLHQPLPRTEVSFCGFHRAVAEQELNLFKFPSCGMTQPCASPAQIMRSQITNAREFRVFTNDPPDRFLTDAVTPHPASPAHATEDDSSLDTGNGEP